MTPYPGDDGGPLAHVHDPHPEGRPDPGEVVWDRDGRPSEARLDRVVRIDPERVRREGAVLAADRFAVVAEALTRGADASGARD